MPPSGLTLSSVSDIEQRAIAAVAELRKAREAGRDDKGRFSARNGAALKDGLRSRQLAERSTAVEAEIRARTEAALEHVGGRVRAGVVRTRIAVEWARVTLLADSHWAALQESGITAKGKRRAAETHYHAARQAAERLAQLLGLDPVLRAAPSVQDYLNGKAVGA